MTVSYPVPSSNPVQDEWDHNTNLQLQNKERAA